MENAIDKILAENKNFCLMPFIATCVESGGRHKPCCKYQTWSDDHNAKEVSLKKLIDSDFYAKIREQFKNGEKPQECRRCWSDEELNLSSLRQSYTKHLGQHFSEENLENPTVKVIDYGFGNVCNAGCITCESSSSSIWHKDDVHLQKYKNNIFERHVYPVQKDQYPHWSAEEYQNLKCISHAQNEAMLSPEFEKTLDALTLHGRPEETLYEISTNGSYYPKASVIEKLKNFSKVEIQFSIDGVGARNDYLRYPLKWSDIEASIERWKDVARTHKNFQFKVRCTISALNVLYLQEVIDWWKKTSDYENNRQFQKVQFGYAWYPSYLNPTILPTGIKRLATERCQDEFLRRLLAKQLLNHPQVENSSVDLYMNRFREFIAVMDRQRKLMAPRVFPELFALFPEEAQHEFA